MQTLLLSYRDPTRLNCIAQESLHLPTIVIHFISFLTWPMIATFAKFIAVHRFSKEMLRKKERIVLTSLSRETEVLEPAHRQAWVLGLPWTFYTDLGWGRELCLSVWGLLHFPVCWLERPGIWSQRSVKHSDLEHMDVGSNIYLLPGGPQTWLFKLSKSPFSPVWSRG